MSGLGSGVSPFGQARLLTVERARLFTRTAESLAEGFEEELGRWLGDVSVSVGSVEQTTLVDLGGGEDPGAGGGGVDLAVVKSLYQVSHGVVVSDLGLALAVVAMLCGGVSGTAPEPRPLSRLETGVFDLVLQPLVDLAVELFGLDAVELGPHVASVSALPASQPEPAVGVPFHLRVSGIEGVVTLGLSGSQLQSYSEELDRRIAGQLASKTDVPSPEIVRAVAPVEVELVAGFELLQVPARELVGLRVGDVLRTRQSVSRPLIARIGGEQLFHIRPAQHGQRLVAELTAQVFHNHTSSTIRNPNGPDRPDGFVAGMNSYGTNPPSSGSGSVTAVQALAESVAESLNHRGNQPNSQVVGGQVVGGQGVVGGRVDGGVSGYGLGGVADGNSMNSSVVNPDPDSGSGSGSGSGGGVER